MIHTLSEDLLSRFAEVPLLDKYGIYQILMTYWAEVMQDDVFVITQDGWKAASAVRELVTTKGAKSKEMPDLVIGKKKYKMDLIPPALMVDRYYKNDQAMVDCDRRHWETYAQELESFIEENLGEDGWLEESTTKAGTVTKASLKSRYKELRAMPPRPNCDIPSEMTVIWQCLNRIERAAHAKKLVAEGQEAVDRRTLAGYAALEVSDIKDLLLQDKWRASLRGAVKAEIERVTQALAPRVKTLEERHAKALPPLEREARELAIKVERHLARLTGTPC